MKIKNIIPIFTALFVVACSATGNSRNNNSGTTAPPEVPVDLGLERIELGFYTRFLNGELFNFNRPTTTPYRREYTGGVFGYNHGGLDGIPVQDTLTNDVVENIYFLKIYLL